MTEAGEAFSVDAFELDVCVPKLRPSRSSSTPILAEDSAQAPRRRITMRSIRSGSRG
jgi:hypothetical protein